MRLQLLASKQALMFLPLAGYAADILPASTQSVCNEQNRAAISQALTSDSQDAFIVATLPNLGPATDASFTVKGAMETVSLLIERPQDLNFLWALARIAPRSILVPPSLRSSNTASRCTRADIISANPNIIVALAITEFREVACRRSCLPGYLI